MKMIIAFLLMTVPVSAGLSDGMWESADGRQFVGFTGLDYTHIDKGSGVLSICRIADWPLDSPVATGQCTNGFTHQLIIGEDSLIFEGETMTQDGPVLE